MKAKREDCILLVVDVQERLLKTIADNEKIVENVKAFVKSAKILNIPVVLTEQEKLGGTVEDILKELPGSPAVKKLCFSCCENKEFMDKLQKLGRKTIIVCGIEAHICVMQTTLDLLDKGYAVFIIKDAVSSHSPVDAKIAVKRMRDAGAIITTTEAIIYELTGKAGTEEFKKILEIVKERRKVLG